ncbi:MAG: aspartate kinase [Bacillota bacterium]
MKIIVQKFGGTSVATPDGRLSVVGHVSAAVQNGYRPVLVVSAMGRAGDPYATDTLIGLIKSAGTGDPHCRELDLLMSCGETISSAVMCHTLRVNGIDALALTGPQAGIITDDNYNNAHILEIRPERIRQCLGEGKVAVVTGFQGITRTGDITTLGRGGSDTTAAALGVALGAELVEIYTDVEGVMTADPRIVPKAKPLKTMTYTEVCEMAHLGARVVHPRAVEIAMEGRVPVKIRSTFSQAPGTLITGGRGSEGIEIKNDRIITGIAHITDMTLIKLTAKEDVNKDGLALKVFQDMAENQISVDLIHVTPREISFIVKEELTELAVKSLNGLPVEVFAEKGFAKVSAVGAGMRGVPGVMARVMRSLSLARVSVYQTTDSHTNISCLVRKSDMQKAAQALHDEFGPEG